MIIAFFCGDFMAVKVVVVGRTKLRIHDLQHACACVCEKEGGDSTCCPLLLIFCPVFSNICDLPALKATNYTFQWS